MGSYLGGVHLELTGENVTECTGGARGLTDGDLAPAYKSSVDPRLNYEQAMEVAMRICCAGPQQRRLTMRLPRRVAARCTLQGPPRDPSFDTVLLFAGCETVDGPRTRRRYLMSRNVGKSSAAVHAPDLPVAAFCERISRASSPVCSRLSRIGGSRGHKPAGFADRHSLPRSALAKPVFELHAVQPACAACSAVGNSINLGKVGFCDFAPVAD